MAKKKRTTSKAEQALIDELNSAAKTEPVFINRPSWDDNPNVMAAIDRTLSLYGYTSADVSSTNTSSAGSAGSPRYVSFGIGTGLKNGPVEWEFTIPSTPRHLTFEDRGYVNGQAYRLAFRSSGDLYTTTLEGRLYFHKDPMQGELRTGDGIVTIDLNQVSLLNATQIRIADRMVDVITLHDDSATPTLVIKPTLMAQER